MLILPLIYVGIVGVAAISLYWHATQNASLFESVRSVRVALFLYLMPLVVGAILIVFMVKPLFASPARKPRLRPLDPSSEPLLFAFVDGVCQVVGAPTPVRIFVDNSVNAGAAAEVGLVSLLQRRLVLVVGLPLVAGLDLRQFAGVLAHEFGHFSQSAGMTLSYLISTINRWFARVVYERDRWDEWLETWSHEQHPSLILIAYGARLTVWATRRILWVLMMLGHLISSFLLRQMEFDADRYEMALSGSEAFIETMRRIQILNLAMAGAHADLSEGWKEGRLADDLPRLVLANVPQIPRAMLDEMDRSTTSRKTGLFDTHPADTSRIAAARTAQAPGLFHVKGPATDVFRDFDALARSVTIGDYKSLFGPGFSPDCLQPVASVVEKMAHAQEGGHALDRFFLGQFDPLRSLPLPMKRPSPPSDPAAALAALSRARERTEAAHSACLAAIPAVNDTFEKLVMAEAAVVLLKASCPVRPVDYALPRATVEAARAVAQKATEAIERGQAAFATIQAAAAERLFLALSLLESDVVFQRLPDGDAWRREARVLYPAAVSTSHRIAPALWKLVRVRRSLDHVLRRYQANPKDDRLTNAVLRGGRDLRDQLQTVATAVAGIDYPFDHAHGQITLSRFALTSPLPDAEQIGDLLDLSASALDRLAGFHARLIGRLVLATEEVEDALGLAPWIPTPDAEKFGART
jgi:Zn-dependent protease with chaperone function